MIPADIRKILRFRIVPFIAVTAIISLTVVYLLQDKIRENNFTKAKMEIFDAILTETPENRNERIIEIIDSTFILRDTALVQ